MLAEFRLTSTEELKRWVLGFGAKAVVRAHASREGDVELDDDGAFRDVDTMEEYQRLIEEQRFRP